MSEAAKAKPAKKSAFRSRLLLIAIICTIAGLGLWAYSLSTAPSASAAGPSASDVASGLISSPSVNSPTPPPADSRVVAQASPALFRFGFSFLVGYGFAVVLRGAIKFVAIAAALATLTLFGLQQANITHVDMQPLWDHVSASLSWIRGEADGFRTFLLGYLPSATAAIVGGVWGFRKSA